MPKKGALSAKREKLERLAVISLEIDEETKALSREGKNPMELVSAVDATIAFMLGQFIQWSYSQLADAKKWTNLAECPKDFNSEVDRHLTAVKMAMRLLYDIPDHRPTERGDTPARVALLKYEYLNASWGQLCVRFKQKYNQDISDGAIERAYDRFVHRIQEDVIRWRKILNDFSTQSARPVAQRIQDLPTPEDVLEILNS